SLQQCDSMSIAGIVLGIVPWSAAGDRDCRTRAVRQRQFPPACTAVGGAERLPLTGNAMNAAGIHRIEGNSHHRTVHAYPVVDLCPRRAGVLAPVKAPGLAAG